MSYRLGMASIQSIFAGLGMLATVGMAQGAGFDSKTWMYQGAKIHVTVGSRESASIGTYLVTVATSGKRATVRADRDGTLVGAWAADIDHDGRFEVIVATQSAGSGSYGKIGVFIWTGDALKSKPVPELNKGQLKNYMGHDQFSVTRNAVYRTFPLFRQKGNDPAKRIGMRTVRLNLNKFRWETP